MSDPTVDHSGVNTAERTRVSKANRVWSASEAAVRPSSIEAPFNTLESPARVGREATPTSRASLLERRAAVEQDAPAAPPEAKTAAESVAKSLKAEAAGSELYRAIAGGVDAKAQVELNVDQDGAAARVKDHLSRLYTGMTAKQILNNVTVYDGHRSQGKELVAPEEVRGDSSKAIDFLAGHLAKGNSLSLRHTNAALLSSVTAGMASDLSSDGRIGVPSRNYYIDVANSERVMKGRLEEIAGQQFASSVKNGSYAHPGRMLDEDPYLSSFHRYAQALSQSPAEKSAASRNPLIHDVVALHDGRVEGASLWERIFHPKAVSEIDAIKSPAPISGTPSPAASATPTPAPEKTGALSVDLDPTKAGKADQGVSAIMSRINEAPDIVLLLPTGTGAKSSADAVLQKAQAVSDRAPTSTSAESAKLAVVGQSVANRSDPERAEILARMQAAWRKDGMAWAINALTPEHLDLMIEIERSSDFMRKHDRAK